MAENTQTTDPVLDILSATFGPTVAAEVVKEEEVKAHDVEVTPSAGADVAASDFPKWWRKNLDGSWRKTCQAPVVQTGYGTTRRHETDTAILKALHDGAESLVQLTTLTGYVKVTCTRSLERLIEEGRVVQTKAPPSGRRGRPAYLYRATTEADASVDVFGVKAALASVASQATASTPTVPVECAEVA
jgi:predicted transcriptional regulator